MYQLLSMTVLVLLTAVLRLPLDHELLAVNLPLGRWTADVADATYFCIIASFTVDIVHSLRATRKALLRTVLSLAVGLAGTIGFLFAEPLGNSVFLASALAALATAVVSVFATVSIKGTVLVEHE